MNTYTITAGDPVPGGEYEAAVTGVFGAAELVPCRPVGGGAAVCAFHAKFVATGNSEG